MTHDQLSNHIDAIQQGNAPVPQDDLQALASELIALTNQPMEAEVATELRTKFTESASQSKVFWHSGWRQVAAMFIGTLFVALTLVTTVPEVRAFTLELLDVLFQRSSETTRTIEYVEFDASDEQYFDTLADFQESVSFDVDTPTFTRPNYTLNFVGYLEPRNVVWLNYSNGYDRAFRILQQPLEDTPRGILWHTFEPYNIGPEAQLVDVQIGDYVGQYVRGSWVGSEEDGYRWSDTFGMYQLRWQTEDKIYEIAILDAPRQDLSEELIAIAESMMD